MGYCVAANCTNSDKKKFRMFRFPSDPIRRKRWIINCRRKDWLPSSSSQLCEIHFESNQFEQNRLDGKKKLTPNAIPTIFNISNLPKLIIGTRKSVYKNINLQNEKEIFFNNQNSIKPEIISSETSIGCSQSQDLSTSDSVFQSHNSSTSSLSSQCHKRQTYKSEILSLKQEIAGIKKRITNEEAVTEKTKQFLTDDQISALEQKLRNWNNETNIECLNLRFPLGVKGYKYLKMLKNCRSFFTA